MPKGIYDRTKPAVESSVTEDVITPKSFLSQFLSGGPIIRHNVYRESENAGLNWDEVREAFTQLNGREYFQKGEFFWRIFPE